MNRHSPGLTEEQCDDISEKSAMFVLRQVKPIIRAAAGREMQARLAAGQQYLDPFYAYAGPVAGVVTAGLSAIWGMMDPDGNPAEQAKSVRDLFHQMVDAQIEGIVSEPPGQDIRAISDAEAKRRKGMQ